MKIVLHWMAKDARRLWPWLAVWGATLVVPLGFGLRFLLAEPAPAELRQADDLLGWLGLAQALVGYVVTLLLIQEDRAIDARAFWPTRPVGPGRLVLAKLGFVLAAGVVFPCLVWLPWWLGCGIGWAGALGAALEWTLFVPVVVVPAALVAALTDSLGRAILWSFIVLAFSMMAPLFGLAFQSVTSPRAIGAGLLAVVGALVVLLAAMAAAVVIAYRQRRYSMTLGGPVAAGAVGMMIVWLAAGFYRPAAEPSPWRPEQAAAVTVSLHGAGKMPAETQRGLPGPQSQVWTSFAVAGGAPGQVVVGLMAVQRWQWPEMGIEREGPLGGYGYAGGWLLPGLSTPAPDQETAVWQAAERAKGARSRFRPRDGLRSIPDGGPWAGANVLVPASVAARMEREPPAYRARLWFALDRQVVGNEVSLPPEGWRNGRAHGMRLMEVEDGGSEVRLKLVEARRSLPWWERLATMGVRSTGLASRNQDGYLLLRPDRREGVRLGQSGVKSQVVAGVQLNWRRLMTPQLGLRRGEGWQTRPGWLDTARLVYVRHVREAVFLREVTHPALSFASGEPIE